MAEDDIGEYKIPPRMQIAIKSGYFKQISAQPTAIELAELSELMCNDR